LLLLTSKMAISSKTYFLSAVRWQIEHKDRKKTDAHAGND